MSACLEFAPLLELRLTDSLGEHQPRLEEHLATCAACRSEALAQDELLSLARLPPPSASELRVLEGLAPSTWREMERARVRRRFARSGLGIAAAAAVAALFWWPHLRMPLGPSPAEGEQLSASSGSAEVLDLGFDDDDADTLDLEDFASLDAMPSVGSMATAGSDDEDDTLLQGEEL